MANIPKACEDLRERGHNELISMTVLVFAVDGRVHQQSRARTVIVRIAVIVCELAGVGK